MYCNLIFVAQLLSCIHVAFGLSDKELIGKIQTTHELFRDEGPTVGVLEQYNSLTRELDSAGGAVAVELKSYLPQVFFKKALIEISLNKEISAIGDLKKCLEVDRLMIPAREKLAGLLLERGDFQELEVFLQEGYGDEKTIQQVKLVKGGLEQAHKLFLEKKYEECIQELESRVIPHSPASYSSYSLHFKCEEQLYLGQKTLAEDENRSKAIISDLSRLITILPVANLKLYEKIANYLLFTELQFDKSWQYVRNCLKVDNDFKECGQVSKFYSKFQGFLKIFEEYSINCGHYYLKNDENSVNEKEGLNDNFDFEFVKSFLLTEDVKVSKIERKKLPYSVQTNYDYLKHKASEFVAEIFGNDKLAGSLKFNIDLDKILCESFIRLKSYSEGKKYCDKVVEDADNPFLPKHLPKIDKLLKNRNYNEAKELLERFNANLRKSDLFLKRYDVIERHLRQRQQEQQRQQQQHHHQQQQQQQQRQRQAESRRKPANDYYKILDISRDADEKTIKKAHRTQTLKYHPDKYKGNDLTPEQIESKMQEINKAYEILSNKELRERYDRGDDPNDPLGAQRQQQGGHPFGGGDFVFNFGQQGFGQQGFGSNFRNQNGGFKFGGFSGFSGFSGFGGSGQKVHVKKNRKRA